MRSRVTGWLVWLTVPGLFACTSTVQVEQPDAAMAPGDASLSKDAGRADVGSTCVPNATCAPTNACHVGQTDCTGGRNRPPC